MKLKINLTVEGLDDNDERYYAQYLGEESSTVDDAIAFLGAVERAVKRDAETFIKEPTVHIGVGCGVCGMTFMTKRGLALHNASEHGAQL